MVSAVFVGGAVLASTLIGSPAQAADTPGDTCLKFTWTTWHHGETCFEWSGDDQWVVDRDTNGKRAGVHVQTDYGKDRYCETNGDYPAGSWRECKYDHDEERCVRFRMYEKNGDDGERHNWSTWSGWYSIRTGDRMPGGCVIDA